VPRTLPDKAQSLLDSLPPYYDSAEPTRAVMLALGNELQLLEDTASRIRLKSFPQNSDDEFNLLALWEETLGIPVQPQEGGSPVPLVQRRAKVLAHLRKRNASAGAQWVSLLSEALGIAPSAWSYQEGPEAYTIHVFIPYDATTYTGAQVLAIAREITPAHLALTAAYTHGFIVGVSQIGVDPL
jgi:hypothetical protein